MSRLASGRSLPLKSKRVAPYGASAAAPVHSGYTCSLVGQLPSGKNAVLITRTGRRYPAQRFTTWREAALAQMSPVTTLRGPVKLYVLYTPGDRRRRDVPGMLDAILHLLEKAEVVEDDAQIVDVSWHTEPMNSCHPGALVSVTRLT